MTSNGRPFFEVVLQGYAHVVTKQMTFPNDLLNVRAVHNSEEVLACTRA
jgi:hypothetical protein